MNFPLVTVWGSILYSVEYVLELEEFFVEEEESLLDEELAFFEDELLFDFEVDREELEISSSSSGALLGDLSSPQQAKINDNNRTGKAAFFIMRIVKRFQQRNNIKFFKKISAFPLPFYFVISIIVRVQATMDD